MLVSWSANARARSFKSTGGEPETSCTSIANVCEEPSVGAIFSASACTASFHSKGTAETDCAPERMARQTKAHTKPRKGIARNGQGAIRRLSRIGLEELRNAFATLDHSTAKKPRPNSSPSPTLLSSNPLSRPAGGASSDRLARRSLARVFAGVTSEPDRRPEPLGRDSKMATGGNSSLLPSDT
jgi:hypothetical protein